MKHNVGVTVDPPPARQVVQEFDCRRPGSQQSPLNLMLLYQLLKTAALTVQIQRLAHKYAGSCRQKQPVFPPMKVGIPEKIR